MASIATFAHKAFLRLEPERAHRLTLKALAAGAFPRAPAPPACLATRLFGREIVSPVGIAAGFDKNAEVPDALMTAGFGFVEVGTVTPRPQAGNPQPRVFRLAEDRAIVNRLGFNGEGLEAVVARLVARKARGLPATGAVGVNIGANRDSADRVADYVIGYRALAPYADYVTVNVSSPNTPGLRTLQGEEALETLLSALDDARAGMDAAAPLVLKVAPDVSVEAIHAIAAAVRRHAVDGLVVSNTTVDRPPDLLSPAAREAGGLSGRPLFCRSTAVLARFATALGPGFPIIGVGGVSDGETAFQKIAAGASAVQLYTGLVYGGPALAAGIHRRLAGALADRGFARLEDAVGSGREAWAGIPLLPVETA